MFKKKNSKLLPLERKSVKGSEMVIPPLSFVLNRKTIQTEVGFRQSGGKLRPLKGTLPHCRRKKNKVSRFSMSKHQDREGVEVEREGGESFNKMGGYLRN